MGSDEAYFGGGALRELGSAQGYLPRLGWRAI